MTLSAEHAQSLQGRDTLQCVRGLSERKPVGSWHIGKWKKKRDQHGTITKADTKMFSLLS